jgi:hypothetical protein
VIVVKVCAALPNKRMQLTVWPVTTLAGRAGVLAASRPEGQGRASPARR